MEFNELIPLHFLSLCFFGLTPIIGFSGLAYIRFSLKDISLARNILVTLIVTAILPLLYMGYGVISVIFILPTSGLITLTFIRDFICLSF